MLLQKVPSTPEKLLQRLKSRNNNFQGMRRVNYIDEESEDEEFDSNEEQLVLQVDGNGSKPFYMEGTMCGNYFKAIFDTWFLFLLNETRSDQKYWGKKSCFRDMIDNERYDM